MRPPLNGKVGRTCRISQRVTPEQHRSFDAAAKMAGYRSTAEWVCSILDREVEILEWSNHGSDDTTEELGMGNGFDEEPTETESTDRVLSTYPPGKT